MRQRTIRAAIVLLSSSVLVPATLAQNKNPKEEVESNLNIGGMTDQAVRNIAARYNLNQEQYEATQRMMEEGVNRFLQEHADEIYPLIRDLTRAEMNPQNLSVSQRRRIGNAAQPLVAEAQKVILQYNEEWGRILSEEQKRLHKWDLDEMGGQFGLIRGNFDRMAAGRAVEGNLLFPEPKPVTEEPPRPTKPPAGFVKPQPGPQQSVTRDSREEDLFDNYVQKFIKEYNLDPAQREAALSIMREYKGYADVHRKAREADYAKVNQKAEEARKLGDFEKAKEAETEIDQLNERILQFLAEMKDRLMTIPRESQKQAREQALAGKAPGETPAAGDQAAIAGSGAHATTQPAKSDGQARPQAHPTSRPAARAATSRPTSRPAVPAKRKR